MAFGDHSGLEVVPQSERADAQKYPYYSPEPIPVHPNHVTDTHKETYRAAVYEQGQARTICGLRRKTFWIVLAVATVVIVGAVGGGVGGALASRSSRNTSNVSSTDPKKPTESQSVETNAIASSSATPSPTSSTTSSTTSLTTTSLVGPTSTILRDCPSSNNSIYSVPAGVTVMQFRKVCELSYLNVNGDDSSVIGVTQTMDECINLCAAYNISNRTQIEKGENRICNSICWRNKFANEWAGGQCYGFTTQNTTSNGESVWRYRTPAETRCDSAALMNQEY